MNYPVFLPLPAGRGDAYYQARSVDTEGVESAWVPMTEIGSGGLYTADLTLSGSGPYFMECTIISTGVRVAYEDTGAVSGVWAYGTRTLTSFGTLVADIAAAVWGATTRTLSAFGFDVTVEANNDKTGYALATASPTLQNILDGITADHGAGAYGAGAGGEYTITVTTIVADSDPVIPIPDVTVVVMNEGETVLISAHQTNAGGTVSFNVEAGTYVLRHRKTGYYFPDDTAEVVAGDVAHTCEGTAYVLPVSADPEMQVLSGTHSKSGVTVKAVPLPGQIVPEALLTVDKQKLTATTAANGSWSLTLYVGISYEITIDNGGWGTHIITVTGEAGADFASYVLPPVEE